MRKITFLLLTSFLFGCSSNTNTNTNTEKKSSITSIVPFKIDFDKSKISEFSIENTENASAKAIVKNLTKYTKSELKALPDVKRVIYSIVVPSEISKESLENTLKFIVSEKTLDKDIDEIIIFAFDDKNDIDKGYTFGKLLWAPKGELGNVTPEIASSNIRDNYQFVIDIKDKVGKITKENKPTQREFEIYNMATADENIELTEDELDKKVMKKFGIKTKKEFDDIFLKVASYKYQ